MSAQAVCPTFPPSAGRPPHSMNEDFRLRREVVIDDVVYVRHVDTTSGDIGDHEDTRQARTKIFDLFLACSLVEVSIYCSS